MEGAAEKKAQRTVFEKIKPVSGTPAEFEANRRIRRSTPDIAADATKELESSSTMPSAISKTNEYCHCITILM